MADEFDSPWKQALDVLLEPCFLLLFPRVHAIIDWSRGWEALDQELLRITGEGATSANRVDRLVKVYLIDGGEVWLLVHIEVQTQPDADFAERMLRYFTRIWDVYQRVPISLAILADDRSNWRPDRCELSAVGTSLRFDFTSVKLLDYAEKRHELENSTNPFAVVVLAHLDTLATRDDAANRSERKLALVMALHRRGWDRELVRKLFGLIDWLMKLSKEIDKQWYIEFNRFQQEARMPYKSPEERMVEYARQDELLIGVEASLRSKFGKDGAALLPLAQSIEETQKLRDFLKAIPDANSIDELRERFATVPSN